MKDKVKTYGKYVAPAAVGALVGFGGYAAYDTPTTQTDTYQNLQEKFNNAQNNADDFEKQVQELQTTVTDKEEKVENLQSQVTQFESTLEQLKAENADLEEAVASGDERVGIVDFFPVFTENTDVEYSAFAIQAVDESADNLAGVSNAEGDYTQIDVNTEDSDEGHKYRVDIVEFEDSEDAEDYEEHERDYADEVSFSAEGDEHTVGVTAKEASEGDLQNDGIVITYEDDDVLQDVDDEDEIESVVVDGDDITDEVKKAAVEGNGKELHLDFEDGNYVNEGDEVEVTFSNADGDEAPETVEVNGETYDYDQDVDQFVYREGNTVVTGEGIEDANGDEDDYDAQYDEFVSQYE